LAAQLEVRGAGAGAGAGAGLSAAFQALALQGGYAMRTPWRAAPGQIGDEAS